MPLQLLGTKEFKAELVEERSSGSTPLGMAENEMRLYNYNGQHLIEWEANFPNNQEQEVEHIGLLFNENKELIDYDGIMGWLPTQAADLIEEHGFKVNRKEFCDV